MQVAPGQIVRVIARFDDYTGLFPYHCHIIEHEDHEMMRQFQVVSCGDGELEPTEECDDGNAASGDGCYPTCEDEDEESFYGLARGGGLSITVSGVTLWVSTSPGDTPADVASAIANAINADPTLQASGISAVAHANRAVTNGVIDLLAIVDPGLSNSPASVPTLAPHALALALAALAGLLLLVAAIARRRSGAPSRRAP